MKKRVNWTISKECLKLLKQAQKLNGKGSLSDLVEEAIRNTYKNKAEFIREQMRKHQSKLMQWKDKLKNLEE